MKPRRLLTLLSGDSPSEREGMKTNLFVSEKDNISVRWQTEVKVVGSHIAPCMPAIRKVNWLSMEDKVPSGRGEFKPVEIPPTTFEAGTPFRKIGEEVTGLSYR